MTLTLEWATRWGRSLESRQVAIEGRSQRGAHTGRARLCFVLVLVLVVFGTVTGCHRDIERSLARAVEAWDSGDYNLAAEEYEKYLSQRPSSEKAPEARFQLANIYYFKLR